MPNTKFPKFPPGFGPKAWAQYMTAGDAWLDVLNLARENRTDLGWAAFYVEPYMVHFILELFAKALAAHIDPTFNPKGRGGVGHRTTEIIRRYAKDLPIFASIENDQKLMLLIAAFEATIDTRFGQTAVQSDGDEKNRLIDITREIRHELSLRTGLR